jgi:hypothetical protein
MTEHLLDFAEEEQRAAQRRKLRRLQESLFVLLFVIVLVAVGFIATKIPFSSEISGPPFFAGWKSVVVLGLFFILALPVAAAFLAWGVGLIPVKKYRYVERFWTAFLIFCILLEAAGLYQLVADYYKSGGY